ncbi:DUF4129 domain-containing protein [Saccharicrinis sp. FJH2]|uniref:DUF4129 domain-containing protein n=1 Tax=Saccharicrinis sp. FJH65 TaxID=3344659 RepID=UPI0035F4C867
MSKKLFCIFFVLWSVLPVSAADTPFYTVDSARIDSAMIQVRDVDTAALNIYRQDSDFNYGQGYQNKTISFWGRLLQWIWEKLGHIKGFYKGMTIAVKTFFWLLVIAILVFAVTKIRFQRFFYTKEEKEVKDYIIDDADEAIEDLDAAIAAEVENKNFRKAIRYQFINVLRKLDGLGVINYSRDKTNRDYLNEIRKKTDSATEFTGLVNIYNAVWYGHFNIDETDYNRLSKSFTNFNLLTNA